MGYSASRMDSNRNHEIDLRFNPQQSIRRAAKKPPPITQSQKELIAHLRQCLDNAGIANDFIIEPNDSYVASHVIRALIRLAKKYDVETGRGRKTLNGI